MKSPLLFFFVLVLTSFIVMGFVSAAQIELPQPIKSGQCGQLLWTSNVSIQTISVVTLPNYQRINIQKNMQSLGNGSFNYTFCDTSQVGSYIVEGQDSNNTVWSYTFKVTPTGDFRGTALPLILLISALVCLAFGLLFKQYFWGIISGILFIVVGVYLTIYGLANFADDFTRTIGISSIGIGIIFFIVGAYEGWLDSKGEGEESDD